MSKKVLLIGNGAREHIIAETLKKSSQNPILITYAKAKNPGIFELSDEYEIGDLMDFEHLKKFALEQKPDFAIVGPDDPIGAGAVDVLEKIGIKSVAPKKSLARLESSKSFTRSLLTKYNIEGNPKFKVFNNNEGIKEFMQELDGQFVVKADGLMGGKGVKVVGDHLKGVDDGVKYALECLKKDGRVVVEEKFIGQEFSLMSFVDGKTVIDMPPIQDHKRAYVEDKGPNTGGMGTYSYPVNLPFLTDKDLIKAHNITEKVMKALEQECGESFKGIMYGGFIITKNGVKLIEYNARFGDPEAMNALILLETDLVEICQAIIDQTLDKIEVRFSKKATVLKYAVPEGYPDSPVKDKKIKIGKISNGAKIYYASVYEKDGETYLGGSRAVAVIGVADDIVEAERLAEDGIKQIQGPVFHREDIGTEKLINKRIEMMKQLL